MLDFSKTFCSSPWLHLRINNDGSYDYCRWWAQRGVIDNNISRINIKEQNPITFFRKTMAPLRQSLLNGDTISGCRDCHLMETHGKVSGRQRQLLKTGISCSQFNKTVLSSPWVHEFEKSLANGGSELSPVDWQVDLGNYCNSSCLFCNPFASSKLATEWKKLGLINDLPSSSWVDDDQSLDNFIEALHQSPKTRYIHFLGGETVITPAFKKILEKLIRFNFNQTVAIGFTTNLTVWDQSIVDLLCQFKEVNLGMSIESLDSINDYVRWPSTIDDVCKIRDRWIQVGRDYNWLMQLRITPNVLTIGRLIPMFDFAMKNNIIIESCNFIDNPQHMRVSVLPLEYRKSIIESFKEWIFENDIYTNEQLVNIRHPSLSRLQIVQDVKSYVSYLETQPDESMLLPELVQYLKLLESNRNNSVLDYLPEYEELFRSAGY